VGRHVGRAGRKIVPAALAAPSAGETCVCLWLSGLAGARFAGLVMSYEISVGTGYV
jgi:hypothetical protein